MRDEVQQYLVQHKPRATNLTAESVEAQDQHGLISSVTFGRPLEMVLNIENTSVPTVVRLCCAAVEQYGLNLEVIDRLFLCRAKLIRSTGNL